MYEYIKGNLASADPTQAVVETGGIGYHLLISLQTYSAIHTRKEVLLWVHLQVREDAHQLYGFATRDEREIFRLLIGVTGVGPNTARMILSAMSNAELRNALITGDVVRIKSVKGIGIKTAEKMVIDLRDKMLKVGLDSDGQGDLVPSVSETGAEAAAALQQLGFQRSAVEKVISRLQKENPTCGLEDMIRQALKLL
ncbi:MAG: Holliday junction branch migration protein RuvA [Bacteroidales bacterium]|jgi:Holliday junction DNA helicase RuvA|nr:Holliday junction branch migration protein RuvA [Bacteroidales bacterium]